MRIVLIGNFELDRQESMLRFGRMLSDGFRDLGHEVETWSPKPAAIRLLPRYRYGGFSKYVGYFDKFVLFPRRARERLAKARAAKRLPDVVHIVDQANAVYGPVFKALPHLVTCHDLLQIRASLGEFPEQALSRHARGYQQWILKSLRGMPLAVCCSHKTLADFLRLTGLPADRARVISNGLNFPFSPVPKIQARAVLQQLFADKGLPPVAGDARGYLLNVGGGQWYKNRPALLRIYASLKGKLAPVPRLLLVGKPLSPELARLARELGVESDLLHLSNIEGRQLEAAYSAAEALIFPSIEEGFGWPVAEAQACGCPVFTTNRPPMTEVGGEGAEYFDPSLPDAAAATIARVWPSRRQLGLRGLARAPTWDPRLMLESYLAVYAELAGVQTAIAGS
jgi:glycosyltransferase involved in cell wall biosynthesis